MTMDIPRGRKVLVIDDMREMEEMLGLLLAHERDDRVAFAPGGLQGLTLAEQQPPELIILDLMMPDLTGYEVFRRLAGKPALATIPVLLLTVLPPQMVYREAQQLGIQGYICKPFEFETLLAARDALLRGETYYPPVRGWVKKLNLTDSPSRVRIRSSKH
jgi:DNA-binding response OmpR family regulator